MIMTDLTENRDCCKWSYRSSGILWFTIVYYTNKHSVNFTIKRMDEARMQFPGKTLA